MKKKTPKAYISKRTKEKNDIIESCPKIKAAMLKDPKKRDHRITQISLAKETGTTIQTIINYEKRLPKQVIVFMKLCKALNVTAEQMIKK